MSPIFSGIVASGISGHLTPPWSPVGAYDAIASIQLTSSVSSIDVAIPSGYKNLIIRGFNISSQGNNAISVRLNNDTTNNYYWQAVDASGGGTPSGFSAGNVSYMAAGYTSHGGYSAPVVAQINDIDSTNKYKTMFAYGGNSANNAVTAYLGTYASVWTSFFPVTNLTIAHGAGGQSLQAGTTLNIYGVR